MWLKCKCGNSIHDISDGHYYKARIITDKQFLKVTNQLCDNEQANISELRKTLNDTYEQLWNTMCIYQCPKCGMIIIAYPNNSNKLIMFTPVETFDEHDTRKQIFNDES